VITYGDFTTHGVLEEVHPTVTIGNFTRIAHGTTCWGTVNYPSVSYPKLVPTVGMRNHLDFKHHPDMEDNGPIVIGNDVWIGSYCDILSGVTIGDGAIIGMKTVVSKDVLPYAVVVGHPMVVKKMRFSDDIISKLLKIKWWDWPIELIKERQDDFLDIDKFVEKYA
jgi:virginiamycin A acetyltransferase